MVRFWPTLGIVCLFALVLYGLISASRGEIMDPQGQWHGPWPMEGADDCRTKLFADGRFEMECRGKEKYAGAGRWSRERNRMKFDFSLYVRDGLQIPGERQMNFRIDGLRNTLCLGEIEQKGQPYCWKRAKP